MAIDLAEKVKDGEGFDHLHIVRVEQLYPFPTEKIARNCCALSKCKRTCLGTRRTEKHGFMELCTSNIIRNCR